MNTKQKRPGQGVNDGTKSHKNDTTVDVTQRQRQSIYHELCDKPSGLTTFYFRSELDIPHPGARIMELRRSGHDIVTIWDKDRMPGGRPHRVARYVLMPERQMDMFDSGVAS